jgi:hypothetical protein
VVLATAAAIGSAAVVADPSDEFRSSATAVGTAWAGELVRGFRAGKRQIIGEWPGTMSEARMRVLACLHCKLEAGVLTDLARLAISAARCEWQQASHSVRRKKRPLSDAPGRA